MRSVVGIDENGTNRKSGEARSEASLSPLRLIIIFNNQMLIMKQIYLESRLGANALVVVKPCHTVHQLVSSELSKC